MAPPNQASIRTLIGHQGAAPEINRRAGGAAAAEGVGGGDLSGEKKNQDQAQLLNRGQRSRLPEMFSVVETGHSGHSGRAGKPRPLSREGSYRGNGRQAGLGRSEDGISSGSLVRRTSFRDNGIFSRQRSGTKQPVNQPERLIIQGGGGSGPLTRPHSVPC